MSQATSTPKDLGKLTVAELKEELQAKGLPVSGRKMELVERLKASQETTELMDDTENTLVPQGDDDVDDISQLEEDMEVLAQEESQSNVTGEDTAFVTAVDDSGNLAEDWEDVNDTVLETVDEVGSVDKETPVTLKDKEPEDGMSTKADSLTVNLDQDIASLVDLEEKQPDQSDTTEGKAKNEEGVLIDAVGEVDDDEFGAVVASMEEGTTIKPEEGVVIDAVGEVDDKEFVTQSTDEKKAETKGKDEEKSEEKTEEKPKPKLPPLPAQPMSNWMIKQFAMAKRFSSLYIRPLTGVDILCDAMVEWANRAAYFCINHERSGKGVAILNFITTKECREAKDSLTVSLGSGVKVMHPTRDMADEIKEAACYKLECPNLAMRTLILEDAPEGTTEDQVCLLFSGAISVSRPEANQPYYEWQKVQYSLPENIEKKFLIEFGSPKFAGKALEEKYELEGQKLSLMSMMQYQKMYRDFCNKRQAEERAKKKEEAEKSRRERERKSMEQVFSDRERIELCKAIKEILSKRSFIMKRNDLPWNDKIMQKEKLSRKLMDIVRAVDADTDKRVNLGMGFPELEKLMTRNTKRIYQRNPKLRRASEQRSQSHRKSDSKKQTDKKDGPKTTGEEKKREVTKSEKEKAKVKDEKEAAKDSEVVTEESKVAVEVKLEAGDGPADEDAVAEGTVAMETAAGDDAEQHTLVEGADMEMGDEGEEVKPQEEAAEEGGESKEEMPAAQTGDGDATSGTEESKKKSEKKDGKRESEKRDKDKDSKDNKRKRTHSTRDSEDLRKELGRLEDDKRGWWSIAQERKNVYLERTDYEKDYKKFGKIMEIHMTDNRVYIRFQTRGAASAALREYWGKDKNICAPPTMGVWKKSSDSEDRHHRQHDDRARKSSFRDRSRDNNAGSRDQRGGSRGGRNDIPSLLRGGNNPGNNNNSRNRGNNFQNNRNNFPDSRSNFQDNNPPISMQLQQQVNQQMMMQQQLQEQQQQQLALLKLQQQQQNQPGLLGSHPQQMLSGGDSRSSAGGGGGVIPSLFGATGVPPVRNSSPDRGFGSGRRRSLSPHRGHSPPRKVLMGSGFDSKRQRMDEYGFRAGDTDPMMTSGNQANPANPVADMLKGLSQVISSKMDEISRIGPAVGEQAVSEVMQSINSMQKGLVPGISRPPVTQDAASAFTRHDNSAIGGRGLRDSSYGNMGGGGRGSLSSTSRGGAMGRAVGMGNQMGRRVGGGMGSYNDSQRMYSKFSDTGSGGVGTSSGLGTGRSSQVLDYAHQSRKGRLLDRNY